jgi:hypothetical protein
MAYLIPFRGLSSMLNRQSHDSWTTSGFTLLEAEDLRERILDRLAEIEEKYEHLENKPVDESSRT